MNTSFTSSAAFMRSTGGLTMAWFMNCTWFCARVPALRIVGELLVHREICAERVHQRRLVVGRAAHPAVGHARPLRDRLALAEQVLARFGDPEELVGEGAGAGVGRARQHGLLLLVMHRVVEPRDRAHRIAECRMRRHVVDFLAVDVDLAAVAQAVDVLLAGEGLRRADHVFWFLPVHAPSPFFRGHHAAWNIFGKDQPTLRPPVVLETFRLGRHGTKAGASS